MEFVEGFLKYFDRICPRDQMRLFCCLTTAALKMIGERSDEREWCCLQEICDRSSSCEMLTGHVLLLSRLRNM